MTCKEFEAMGMDAEHDASLNEAERAAAREHISACPRCAALEHSWQAARIELGAFAAATTADEAPARVEMRLRQEFRTQHHTFKARRVAVISAWALATAAVLVGAVSWRNWKKSQREEIAGHLQVQQNPANFTPNNGSAGASQAAPEQGSAAISETLVASSELGDFTLLPGVLPADTDDTAIFRVRLQRSALGALGLPVNEERASEWIQVDMLVGNDGLPQAVRLPQ
jgi:anti-sigma factor RsiW